MIVERILAASVIALLSGVPLAGSDASDHHGLLFRYYQIEQYQGDPFPATSLTLPASGYVKPGAEFVLEFDVAFWEPDFGRILEVKNGKGESISLFITDWKNKDTSYVEFNVGEIPRVCSFPIPKRDLHKGRWYRIAVEISAAGKQAVVSIDQARSVARIVPIPAFGECAIVFGEKELCDMAVRDVRILGKNGRGDRKLLHHWPLAEVEGAVASDVAGGKDGAQDAGIWLATKHMALEKLGEFETTRNARINYDERLERFIVFDDQTLSFYTAAGTLLSSREHHFNLDGLKGNEGRAYDTVFEPFTGRFFLHEGGGGAVGVVDLDSLSLRVFPSKGKKDLYHAGARFADGDGNLYILGGYGWYRYKKELKKFSFEKGKWDTLATRGDSLTPRTVNGWTAGRSPYEYYFVGGFGNLTGAQEGGAYESYDFWKLDLTTGELKKLWKMPEKERPHRFTDIAYDRARDEFLVAYIDQPGQTYVGTVKGSSPEIRGRRAIGTILGDSALTRFVYFDLTINNITGELLIAQAKVGKSATKVAVYSALLPLIPPAVTAGGGRNNIMVLGILGSVALGLGLYRAAPLVRRRRTKAAAPPRAVRLYPSARREEQAPVVIHLFERFVLVVDAKEVGSGEWRSKKARELFIYILLHGQTGVRMDEAAAVFWPDMGQASAVNSRNVALSMIRKELGRHADLLQRTDGMGRIVLNDNVYCDYFHLMGFDTGAGINVEEAEGLVERYGAHGLLPAIEENWAHWVVPYRDRARLQMEKLAGRLAAAYDERGDWDSLVSLATQMLEWDDLDEQAIGILIRALKKKGNLAVARAKFSAFAERHKRDIGEEFPLRFESL